MWETAAEGVVVAEAEGEREEGRNGGGIMWLKPNGRTPEPAAAPGG